MRDFRGDRLLQTSAIPGNLRCLRAAPDHRPIGVGDALIAENPRVCPSRRTDCWCRSAHIHSRHGGDLFGIGDVGEPKVRIHLPPPASHVRT